MHLLFFPIPLQILLYYRVLYIYIWSLLPLLFSSTPSSSPTHAPYPDFPQNQLPPPQLSPTASLTSSIAIMNNFHLNYLALTSRLNPGQVAIAPSLPQGYPHIRSHKLHNYASLMNGSYDVCSSVGTSLPNTSTHWSLESLYGMFKHGRIIQIILIVIINLMCLKFQFQVLSYRRDHGETMSWAESDLHMYNFFSCTSVESSIFWYYTNSSPG